VYVFGLVAACFLGLGFVLQQDAAARAPLADILSFRLLLDLMKVPRWLLGIGFMVIGQLLSAVALSMGDVSRVAPLLATNLLFAMALARRISGQRLGRSGWAGVVLLSGGVAAFVAAGSPQGSDDAQIGALRRGLVLGSVVAVALVMVVIARHLRLAEEPPWLAAGAGVLYGFQDALTRDASDILSDSGIGGLLTAWQPYVIVTSAVIGLVLVQSAFEAGPLRQSLPALTAAEPLSAIACGIGFLGDTVRMTPLALIGEVLGLGAAVVGVFILGRHPAMPTGTSGPDDDEPAVDDDSGQARDRR
ncbi:MAG TPA: DMT family transporter, partial [Streptomyces sp.]|nr:DMT family transporter [Streptomyces sp.]